MMCLDITDLGKIGIQMIFRQLLDAATSTYTYLLADPERRAAILIDTVFEQHLRDLAILRELGLTLAFTLETHVHADHVTGASLLREATGCVVTAPARSGVTGADRLLAHGDVVTCGAIELETRETPGHTEGCVTYVLGDRSMAFTGDALLIRGAGRTDFQGGDPSRLFRSVREQIFTLPGDCAIYPGHDYEGRTVTTVAEERAHNPRLGDHVREQDFVGYMNNLGLPHPKRMADAVPANLVAGKPRDTGPRTPTWGPVIRTFAGVWEVPAEWVFTHRGELNVIDVREREEVKASPLPVLREAVVLPLSELRSRLDEVPRDRPIVLLCPAGARSAIAATILEKAGVEKVASMRGGILEWLALGFTSAEIRG